MTIQFLKAYNQRKLKTGFFVDRIIRLLIPDRDKNLGYSEEPEKILVIQSHLIGDVMMAVPVLKALKRRYPDAKVCLFANSFAKELLNSAWFVDEIYTAPFPWGLKRYGVFTFIKLFSAALKLREMRFDLMVDAQIDFRNAFLMFITGGRRRLGYDIVGGRAFLTDVPEFPEDAVHLLEGRLSILNYLGIDTSDKRYERLSDSTSRAWVEEFMVEKGISREAMVAVHPGASVKEKLWSPEKFAEVISRLEAKGLYPVLIEGPGDAEIVRDIKKHLGRDVITLRTTLKNLAAFFERCRLVICLDSAASHLASAAGVPAVVIYGPQWPYLSKPFDRKISEVWIEDIACRPCSYNRCIKPRNECMEMIEARAVVKKAEELLSEYPAMRETRAI